MIQIYMFHVTCINQMYNLKKLTNALGCMNVILLHSKHQHDSATHFIHKMIPLL